MVTMVVSLLLTPLLLGVDPSAPNGKGNAPNENPLLIPGWVHMNYQPFPREAHFTAVDGNWTATIWFPAAVRHTSNKCSSRVPNINMCNLCANGHKSTPPTGGRELTVEPTHAASATRTSRCSGGTEPSRRCAPNAIDSAPAPALKAYQISACGVIVRPNGARSRAAPVCGSSAAAHKWAQFGRTITPHTEIWHAEKVEIRHLI